MQWQFWTFVIVITGALLAIWLSIEYFITWLKTNLKNEEDDKNAVQDHVDTE